MVKQILLQNQNIDTFETGVKYHMYHAFALLFVGVLKLLKPEINFNLIGYLFLFGIIIFSGSLYTLSITNIKWLGAITPIGGVLFLTAWILLTIKILNF